jgi:2-methylcitrate dehydratase PrpD
VELGPDDRSRELRDPARDHCRSRAWSAEGALIDDLLGTGRVDDAALDAAGRLIADSLICGLAGAGFERSRALRRILLDDGGRREATVIGSRRRLPAPKAAMANAEAMNLLDADDTFLNAAHFGSLIVAVALAEAERVGAGWTALRRAVVLGFELDARLTNLGRAREGMIAPGLMMPGAALAAALVGGADPDRCRDAVAIALRTAPGPTTRDVSLARLGTLKYSPYASLAHEAIFAARLAAQGYRSAPEFLLASPGFLDAQQIEVREGGRFKRRRGWWIEKTSLKPWPSFRIGHPALDAIRKLVEQHAIAPGEIESIEIRMDPRALALPFHNWPDPWQVRTIDQPIAASMNLRLSAALAAMGVPPGPSWASARTLGRPALQALTARVGLSREPAVDAPTFERARDRQTGFVHRSFAQVRIRSRGRTLTASRTSADGDHADWPWLRRKSLSFLGDARLVESLSGLGVDSPLPPLTLAAR